MPIPTPTASLGFQVSSVREVTQGTTPAGNLTELPCATFDPSGGDVTRTKAANVAANRLTPANIAEDVVVPTSTMTSDLLYDHYNSQWEEVLGLTRQTTLSYSGSDVAAVSSGNKLTKGSGTWPFAAGDVVLVAGQTTNGTLYVAEVESTATTDLVFTTASKDLVDEASGAAITVSFVSRYRCGASLLTSTYQLWDSAASTGEILRGHSMHSLQCQWTHPNKPSLSWTGMGAFTEAVTAALANTVTAAAAQFPANSNVDFGAATAPTGFGGGFRYGGILYDVRIQGCTVSWAAPNKTVGGSGVLGPQAMYGDSQHEVKLSLTISNDSSNARDLLAAARDPDTIASVSWCWRYPNGKLEHWLFPALDPSKGKRGGVKASGEDEFQLEWMAHDAGGQTMFQRVCLN